MDNGNNRHRILSKLCWRVPKRCIILFLMCCFHCNSYSTTSLFKISIHVWGNVTDKYRKLKVAESCNRTNYFKNNLYPITRQPIFKFTSSEITAIKELSSIGSTVMVIPAGIMIDLHGTRRIILFYGIVTTFLAIMGPTFIYYSNGNVYLLGTWSAVLGFADSIRIPAVLALIGQWSPKFLRNTMIGLFSCSWYLGYTGFNELMYYLMFKTRYWPSIFYMAGSTTCVLTFIWFFFGYSSFERHPFISQKETRYLTKHLAGSLLSYTNKRIPYTKILKSLPFWASFFNHIGLAWSHITLYNYVVLYSKTVLHVGIANNTIMGRMVPSSIMIVSLLIMSTLCDFLNYKGLIHGTTLRKMFSNFGAAGVSIYSLTIIFAGCNQAVAYGLYCFTVVYKAAYNIGVFPNNLDLTVNFVGTLTGMTTAAENVVHMALPQLAEEMVQIYGVNGWRNTMVIQFAVIMCTNLFFVIVGRANEQPWNLPKFVKKQ